MNKKQLKYYILAGIGLLIIIWALYTLFSGHYFDREVRICKELDDLESYCVAGLAIGRGNPYLCSDVYGAYFDSLNLARCLTQYVQYSNDSKVCDLISAKNIKGEEINNWSINNCYKKAWEK